MFGYSQTRISELRIDKYSGYIKIYKGKTMQKKGIFSIIVVVIAIVMPCTAFAMCPYNANCLDNPYGAGSPYKPNGLMNPYSQYGSPYSNKSWTNPYATNAPKLYDSQGNYLGRLSTNPYAPDSISNPYGKYGSPYSPDSINNPYGAGNPYSNNPIYVVPQR